MDTQNDGLWFGKGGSGFNYDHFLGIYVKSLGVYVYPTYGEAKSNHFPCSSQAEIQTSC